MLCQEIEINKIIFKLEDEEELPDDFRMDELARSIQQYGLLSPILVRTRNDGRYDLLAGKRRLFACKMLGWEKIPAIIRDDLRTEEVTAIFLTENLPRAEPAPMIITRNLKKIYDRQREVKKVADILALDPEVIERYLTLLNLHPDFQERLMSRVFLTAADSLAFLAYKVSSHEEQKKVREYIVGFNPLLQMEVIEEYAEEPEDLENICDEKVATSFKIRACGSFEDCGHLSETYKRLFQELLELARVKRNFDLLLEEWIRQMEKSK